jgi:hypothetical protein
VVCLLPPGNPDPRAPWQHLDTQDRLEQTRRKVVDEVTLEPVESLAPRAYCVSRPQLRSVAKWYDAVD